jgi:hypothetical protein
MRTISIGREPHRRALDRVLVGRCVEADGMLEPDRVARTGPADRLAPALETLAARWAEQPQTALRFGREAIAPMSGREYGAMPGDLRETIVAGMPTEDAQRGIGTCFDTRRPAWTGR